jgi:apolipoprotein N-acyltransferase
MHLVPFGEYIPLKSLLAPVLGPVIPYEYGVAPGDRPLSYEIAGWKFAPTICYEDVFPELVASFARRGGGFDCIVNVTNEGWYKDGSELDQHLAIAAFRAVECRAGLIRAANTGISAFVSPTGRIVSKLIVDGRDREIAGVLHGRVLTAAGRSPYFAVGEFFGKLCTVAWVCCVAGLALAQTLRRNAPAPA